MIELLNRHDTLTLNKVFASFIIELQEKYKPHPDFYFVPGKEFFDPSSREFRFFSQEECDIINREKLEDYDKKSDKIEVISLEDVYAGTTNYIFEKGNIDNYIQNLAIGFTSLAKRMEWGSVLFLSEYAEPWYIEDNDYPPLVKAIDYFKSIGVHKDFTGGIRVSIESLTEFLKNYFWLNRCNNSPVHSNFSIPGKDVVMYLCQYGTIHFYFHSESLKQEIEKYAKESGMTPVDQCFEPFSDSGKIEGRQMRLDGLSYPAASRRKRIISWSIFIILIGALVYGIRYAWLSFPLISGFAGKTVCSCLFITGQQESVIKQEELAGFPYSLANTKINWNDSTVSAAVWGFAKRKAIYRKGLGCTLINELPENEIRSQIFIIPEPPRINADTVAWPSGDRLPDTIPSGLNIEKLRATVDKVFLEKDTTDKVHTRALLVAYKGQLVAEKYAPGFNRQSPMLGWSMAKSFTGAMIGLLVNEGRLDLSSSACPDEWKNPDDPRNAITVENLLQQMSGLDFREDYTRYSEVTDMLFNKGDMASYATSRSLKDAPGTVFNYNGGNTNILSKIIRNTIGEKEYASFPYQALFHKIAMDHTLLEPDASGTYVGSSYIYATARDYARFGLLYYYDGIWNGDRVLPEGWVTKSRTSPAANKQKSYGYQFRLNGFRDESNLMRAFPDVPADMYYAKGFGGQGIYIIPSKHLVVIRLGLHEIDANQLLKEVIEAIHD